MRTFFFFSKDVQKQSVHMTAPYISAIQKAKVHSECNEVDRFGVAEEIIQNRTPQS